MACSLQLTFCSLFHSRAGLALGRKQVIHGIDFRLEPIEDCVPRGALSHESFTPAP
jgi:hypothetical protein